jgi:hypothetical protein
MQMLNVNELDLNARGVTKGDESLVSPLQLQLAAMLIGNIVEGNGGEAASEIFWDDDSFDLTEESEFDSDMNFPETLPEMDIINHNIFECD